jgi:hypothetical protein
MSLLRGHSSVIGRSFIHKLSAPESNGPYAHSLTLRGCLFLLPGQKLLKFFQNLPIELQSKPDMPWLPARLARKDAPPFPGNDFRRERFFNCRTQCLHSVRPALKPVIQTEQEEIRLMEHDKSTNEKFMPAQAAQAAALVAYQPGCIVSREILKKETGKVTLFAFDRTKGWASTPRLLMHWYRFWKARWKSPSRGNRTA